MSDPATTVLDALLLSVQKAAAYNRHELAPPRVVLWTDAERLWERAIAPLRRRLGALWTLGDFDPAAARGPALWLRHQLDRWTGEGMPVLYLPGVGRADFRSAAECPALARHLFALQFQGQFWCHRNGQDWTPSGFLGSPDSGLGFNVAGDQDTRRAVQESLAALLSTPAGSLRGRRLEAADFRALVTRDPVRTLLLWTGRPEDTRKELENEDTAWQSFCAVCRDRFGFDPATEGALGAAEKLAGSNGPWEQAWQRYKEAPASYPGVKERLDARACCGVFEPANEYRPKSNLEQETLLEKDLLGLEGLEPKAALARLATLAAGHAPRADWVWAKLGEAPLARAMVPLGTLAGMVTQAGSPASWAELADYMVRDGWRIDRAALEALAAARKPAALKAVGVALRAVYRPWLERLALLAQALPAYPANGPAQSPELGAGEGVAILFADGLRLDVARMLEERLLAAGLEVAFSTRWSPLPTVTATAKPANDALAAKLGGPLAGQEFEPREREGGRVLDQPRFKALLDEAGVAWMAGDETRFAVGCAWTESGRLDEHGHGDGARLAWRLEEELSLLAGRIKELLDLGWSRVRVITDHGWLLLPGGLPKAELPRHLTESRWGRCAVPGKGAQHGLPRVGWYWDNAEEIVLAPGIQCFVAGVEYAHGGLTPQEALVPTLVVGAKGGGSRHVALKEFRWAGLRVHAVFEGAEGLTLDLRGKAADPASSYAEHQAEIAADGQRTTLLVKDDHLDAAGFLVVLDKAGQPVFKKPLVVGES